MRIGSNVHTSKHTHMFDMLHIILYIFICTKWNEMKKGDRSRSFIKYWWIGGKCLCIFHHHCQEVGNSLFLALRSTVFQQPTRNYYCVFFFVCLFVFLLVVLYLATLSPPVWAEQVEEQENRTTPFWIQWRTAAGAPILSIALAIQRRS